MTHLLKLVDKKCKYIIDTACIVEDIYSGHDFVYGLTDIQTDRETEWNQYTPLNYIGEGYNYSKNVYDLRDIPYFQ